MASFNSNIPFLVFLGLLLLGQLLAVGNAKKQCGMSSFKGGIGKTIINGNVLKDPTKLPWMVALFHRGSFECTASLIGPKHILTAGHCVEKIGGGAMDPKEFHVLAGIVDYEEKAAAATNASLMIQAEHIYRYGISLYHDIAIVELEKELVLSDKIHPICLSMNDQSAFNKLAVIAGWGVNEVMEDEKQSFDSQLRFGHSEVLSDNTTCKRDMYFQDQKDLCVSGKGLSITCNGDSGSPMIVKLDGQQQWTQIGVTSRGVGQQVCGPIQIFTRVGRYCDWIKGSTKGEVQCGY